jgi:hypothetical protein
VTPLEAAWKSVLESPDQAPALRVLGDALIEVGDPLGEFIHLQLRADYDGYTRYLKEHAAALLGDAARLKAWFPRFEFGFLRGASLETASDLEQLMALPIARFLESLSLRHMLDDRVEQTLEILSTRAPQTLRILTLLGPFVPLGVNVELPVKRITASLPQLEVLDLGGWNADFRGATSRRLRMMTAVLQGDSLGEARFPALEEVSLRPATRRELLPLGLLAGDVAPKLRALTLEGVLWPEQLQELSVSALLRGLQTLNLSVQWGTGWHEVLIQTADSFAHLETLNVVVAREHEAWGFDLQDALPHASVVVL